MPALALALCLTALAPPTGPVEPPAVQFDRLTPADAAQLAGLTVRVEFTVARPAYTWRVSGTIRTITGPAEVDDQERTAVLRGDRVTEMEDGARVSAVGVVRVIRHETATVGGVEVPEWVEVRFEER